MFVYLTTPMFSIFTQAIEFDCLFLAPAPPPPPLGYATERTNVPVGAYCFCRILQSRFLCCLELDLSLFLFIFSMYIIMSTSRVAINLQ